MNYPKESIEWHVQEILKQLGEDPEREGLRDTPARYVRFLREFLDVQHLEFTTFDAEGMDEMILQRDIPFYSLCEHHLAPFFGVAHLAYIPQKRIVGLSKLARTVDFYASRFQNQERLTCQIASRIWQELTPKGVAVTLEAKHLCMTMRGVKKHDTKTVTTQLMGYFKSDQRTRTEYFASLK